MPLQNRVTPWGEIVASPARGTLMGNRGILHDDGRKLGTGRWRHPHWVTCRLTFGGRHRQAVAPCSYTELFFLDEPTAFAAGHRPCAECRREDFLRFRAAWTTAHGRQATAPEIDRVLHAARIEQGTRRQMTWATEVGALPDGTFVVLSDRPGEAWLQWGGLVRRWTHHGYDRLEWVVPTTRVSVLTPQPTVMAFAAGYVPIIDDAARRSRLRAMTIA